MYRILVIILVCVVTAGQVQANKELDSLFSIEIEYYRDVILEEFPSAEFRSSFVIPGVLSENYFNEKYNITFARMLEKILENENYDIYVKIPLRYIPDLNLPLRKFECRAKLNNVLGRLSRYSLIPKFIYLQDVLRLNLIIYDIEKNEFMEIGTREINIAELQLADAKAWTEMKSLAYVEIAEDNKYFKIQSKMLYNECTCLDVREYWLPNGNYKIKFKNVLGIKGSKEFTLGANDSLRINTVISDYKKDLKLVGVFNFFIPGIGIFLLPNPIGGSIDEIGFQMLYITNTIYFYTYLSHLDGNGNPPGDRAFLSEKARNNYIKKYDKDVAWTCALYLMNVSYGFLFYHLYSDKHIKIEPKFEDLRNPGNENSSFESNVYGINLTYYFK